MRAAPLSFNPGALKLFPKEHSGNCRMERRDFRLNLKAVLLSGCMFPQYSVVGRDLVEVASTKEVI
jgi:hypothetical protein